MPHMYAKNINPRLAAAAGIGLLAVTLGLSGCGTPTAGSAAVVGDQRISESELNSEVEAVLALQGLPATDSSNELITSTLDEMITAILVEELASREKVEVTQGEIDDLRLQYIAQAGGQEAFEDQIGGQGIPFSEVDSIIQINIQVAKLGDALEPQGTPDERSAAVFIAVANLSTELGTEVSPRFGTWDPESLSVGPTSDTVSEPQSIDLGSE